MAKIWIEDNKVFVKYKDYTEYITLGKINGSKWDGQNKVWYIEDIESNAKDIESFLFLNKGLISGEEQILNVLSTIKPKNVDIQFKKNKIYVAKSLINTKDQKVANLFSLPNYNIDDYYVFNDDTATRLMLAQYYNLDISLNFNHREELDVDNYMPEFLFNYQVEGVSFVLNKYISGYSGILIADEMGLGKTVQALSSYYVIKQNKPNTKLVIVATKSTMRNAWEHDLLKFFNQRSVIADTDDLRNWIFKESDLPVITNYEALAYVYREGANIEGLNENYILILDEATKMKNTSTSIYKTIKALRGKSFVIALTGTPLENSLLEFHAIMTIIQPNFMNKNTLNNVFVTYKRVKFGAKQVTMVDGYKNLKLFHQFVKPFMIRRTKEIISMPEKIIRSIYVELSPEQERIIEELKRIASERYNDTVAKYATLTLIKRVSDHPRLLEMGESDMSKDVKVQDYKSPKLDMLINLIKKEKPPIVVFTEFEDMAQIIYDELSKFVSVAMLSGADSVNKRNSIVNDFKQGTYSVLVATDALAYGVNLQFANTLINFDVPWNPAKRAQRIDRIHRVGIKETKYIFDLVSDGLEKHAYRIITEKLDIFAQTVEGKDSITESSVMKQLAQNYLDIIDD